MGSVTNRSVHVVYSAARADAIRAAARSVGASARVSVAEGGSCLTRHAVTVTYPASVLSTLVAARRVVNRAAAV